MAKKKNKIIVIQNNGGFLEKEVLKEHPQYFECKGENGCIEFIDRSLVVMTETTDEQV